MKQHLSASEFASLIGKDPKTITRWIQRGLIPGTRRVGSQYQIPIEEAERAKTLQAYPPREIWPE